MGTGQAGVGTGCAFFLGTDDSEKERIVSEVKKKLFLFKLKNISLSYYQVHPRNVTENGPERTVGQEGALI